MVSVPENTRSILVTLTNCNLDKQVSDPVFYQGDGVHMFRHELLKAKDQYLCRIFVWLDVAEIAVVLFLQLMDIRDLTQTLWMTHVMIGLAVLYFIYTICNKFYHHTTTHALWICHLISCLRKEEAVYNASSRNIHLQIACGYAVFDSRTDADPDALQKRADQNMYENKKQLKTFSYR